MPIKLLIRTGEACPYCGHAVFESVYVEYNHIEYMCIHCGETAKEKIKEEK